MRYSECRPFQTSGYAMRKAEKKIRKKLVKKLLSIDYYLIVYNTLEVISYLKLQQTHQHAMIRAFANNFVKWQRKSQI